MWLHTNPNGKWNLLVQTAMAVFSQNDIGQLEHLHAEIPVSHESLFGSQVTNVVEQAKWTKDWDKFVKVAEL